MSVPPKSMQSLTRLRTTLQRRVLVICLSWSIAAAPAPGNAQGAGETVVLNAQAIRAHAEFLSSDLLEGRATGSRGYELAVAYVAAQFRQYGLTALDENGSYLQTVPLVEAIAVLPGSAASLKRDNSTTNFEFSKDYLPSANFFNASTSLTAPLAFAGYGIDAPELKYNDFTDLELQGRIAIIFSGAPERFNSQAHSYYAWRDAKYASLAKQGALGVIEIDNHDVKDGRDARDHEAPSHWERAVAMSWVSEMRLANGDDQANERFPELKVKFRFNANSAAALFGNGHSLEQVMQALKSGEPLSFTLPGTMTLTTTTGLRRIDSSNVLAAVRGSDPRLQNEYILVAANLDQLGRGAAVNGDSIYNGLQRNAVGVAMLLEMARSIAASPTRPRRSILFAAVTAGEKGAQGLEYLLSAGPVATRHIVAGVVLDTPLPIARTREVIAAGADQSSLGTLLVTAAERKQLRVEHADAQQYSVLSDNLAPLARANIPVLSLRGGVRARGRTEVRSLQQEWLRLHINQPSDDLNNTPLDTAAARELASLNAAMVLQLANVAERPLWYRSSLAHRKLNKD
jgi:Peptidase family M28